MIADTADESSLRELDLPRFDVAPTWPLQFDEKMRRGRSKSWSMQYALSTKSGPLHRVLEQALITQIESMPEHRQQLVRQLLA